jgi:pyruvate dehydrogenase E2 component (dihydrolipoamide acetyltransferase)
MPAATVRNAEVVDFRLSDGRMLRARRLPGRGSPLVLLHGLLDSSEGWSEMALSSPRPSVAFDLPGFGGSDLPCLPLIAAYARDIADAVVGLGLQDVTLVGHSLGGAVGAAVADLLPDRVVSLVLLAPAGFGRIPLAEAISLPGIRTVAERMLPLVLKTPLALNVGYRVFVTAGAAPTPDMIERVRRGASANAIGATLATQAVVAAGLSARSRGRGKRPYAGPVAVLWGDADRVVPLSHATAVRRSFVDATLSVWPGMGHHPQRERAVALAAFIEAACPHRARRTAPGTRRKRAVA